MDYSKIKIISKYKLLCESDDSTIYCRGNKIYIEKRGSKEYRYIGRLPINRKYKIIQDIRIAQRLFRLEPRCGVFTDHDEAIISMHGSVYRISVNSGTIKREHRFRKGMNNPLAFCKVVDVPGFEDGILYGEYFGNEKREEVNIFFRNIEGKWEKIYSFKSGTVQHIHRIFVHKTRKSIFVLTGDKDSESAIWEFTDNFKHRRKIIGGKQKFRACVAFPYNEGIIYATDTPLDNNAIFQLSIGDNFSEVKKILDTNGPCIYGNGDDRFMVFATSVEPDSRLRRLIYIFSYKLGAGVKDRYSYIYYGNSDTGFLELRTYKKDILPMLLFGFGTFQVPLIKDKRVVLTGQSLKNCDGKTLEIELV